MTINIKEYKRLTIDDMILLNSFHLEIEVEWIDVRGNNTPYWVK